MATFGVWSVAAVFLAALAVLIALNQSLGFFSGWKQYSTAVGEQRVIELQDGSTVRLNTQSRIAVRLSEHTRDIRLISGEAIFKVHHDTARPFRVHTLGAFIQAVGTEFNVYRRADRTKVAVLEGRVQISSGPRQTRSRWRQRPVRTAGAPGLPRSM
ncbi:MAG: FecR domain-containing protein [Gammaproteobacteria bacterium]